MLPSIKVRHGGEGVPQKAKARVHPMVKLKNYIDKNNLRLVDFFNKFDKDHSMSVTREEFAAGIEVGSVVSYGYGLVWWLHAGRGGNILSHKLITLMLRHSQIQRCCLYLYFHYFD